MEVIFSLTGALFKAGKEGVIWQGWGEESEKEERRKKNEGRK